jgi:Mg2+/Co2+ transporter CorC
MVLILSASAQHVNVEVILREAPSSPGSRHIEQLLDDFHHTGPNGTHVCLVLEVLGPNIPTVIDDILLADFLRTLRVALHGKLLSR